MSGDAGAFAESEVETLMTPYHINFQVRRSGYGQVGIGRSSGDGLNTGCQEKAPVRCPCRQPVGYTPWCSMDVLFNAVIFTSIKPLRLRFSFSCHPAQHQGCPQVL